MTIKSGCLFFFENCKKASTCIIGWGFRQQLGFERDSIFDCQFTKIQIIGRTKPMQGRLTFIIYDVIRFLQISRLYVRELMIEYHIIHFPCLQNFTGAW